MPATLHRLVAMIISPSQRKSACIMYPSISTTKKRNSDASSCETTATKPFALHSVSIVRGASLALVRHQKVDERPDSPSGLRELFLRKWQKLIFQKYLTFSLLINSKPTFLIPRCNVVHPYSTVTVLYQTTIMLHRA